MSEAAGTQANISGAETASARPRRRLSGKRVFAITAVLAGAAAGAWFGWSWWTQGRFQESTNDAYVGGDVTVLAPKVAGLVSEVLVADNQTVRAGDLLIRIDDRDFRAQFARASAAVAGEEAAIANLDASRRLQDAVVRQAQTEIAASEAELTRTTLDERRYSQLVGVQAVSVQSFQRVTADHQKAVAADRRARAALEAAERQLDVIETQKRQALAMLDMAKAERQVAALNLAYTDIRAPIDGVVGNRSARVGSYATVGSSLISIVPARGLWIDANFKESQLSAVRPGQQATIVADVLPGEAFVGHVESLAPATGSQFSVLPPENATGNFTKIVQRVPIRIRLDGDAARLGRLRPGLSVTASIDIRGGGEPAALAQSPGVLAGGRIP